MILKAHEFKYCVDKFGKKPIKLTSTLNTECNTRKLLEGGKTAPI